MFWRLRLLRPLGHKGLLSNTKRLPKLFTFAVAVKRELWQRRVWKLAVKEVILQHDAVLGEKVAWKRRVGLVYDGTAEIPKPVAVSPLLYRRTRRPVVVFPKWRVRNRKVKYWRVKCRQKY